MIIALISAVPAAEQEPDTDWYDTQQNTFTINSAGQLAGLAKLVNESAADFNGKTISLANDISLFGTWAPWTPIGTDAKPFKGTFDGGGNKITDLLISNPQDFDFGCCGLFGHVAGGTVKNLVVEGEVEGEANVGGIVGLFNNGSIINCSFKGTVKSWGATAGGVAGWLSFGSSAENCFFEGVVSGSSSHIGGVVGLLADARTAPDELIAGKDNSVTNCYSTDSKISGNAVLGGVAGYVYGGSVTSCYSTGAEISNGHTAGGVVG